jgi:hypothetical protein
VNNALINVEAFVTKQIGEPWHLCQYWLRLFAVLVTLDEAEAAAPLCVCGSPLQKSQLQPLFSYLDFLHGEDPPESEDRVCEQQECWHDMKSRS